MWKINLIFSAVTRKRPALGLNFNWRHNFCCNLLFWIHSLKLLQLSGFRPYGEDVRYCTKLCVETLLLSLLLENGIDNKQFQEDWIPFQSRISFFYVFLSPFFILYFVFISNTQSIDYFLFLYVYKHIFYNKIGNAWIFHVDYVY